MQRRSLRGLLEERRRHLAEDLHVRLARLRGSATSATPPREEDDDPADLDAALIQMRTAMLRRIDQALLRLSNGQHGWCPRCRQPIGEARLRALPFAVFCRDCENARESAAAQPAAREPWPDEGRRVEGPRDEPF
jgi:DnaK suppressor protein